MAGVAGGAAPRGAAVRAAGVLGAVLAALLWLPAAAWADGGEGGGTGDGGGAGDGGGWAFAAFTARPAATDYADRTVTLAGRLSGEGRDGLPRFAAGETVDLVAGASGGAATLLGTVRTGPGGGFLLAQAAVAPPDGASGPGPFTVPVRALHRTAPGGYGDWDAEAHVDITVTPSAVRLTARSAPGAAGPHGGRVTVTGLVERAAGAGAWAPVADVAVLVGYAPDDGATTTAPAAPAASTRTVRTGADGRFTADVAAGATGTVTVSLAGADDPYLDLGSAAPRSLHVTVEPPATAPAPTAATTAPAGPTRAATRVPAAVTASPAARRSAAAAPAPSTAPPRDVERPDDLAVTGMDAFTREAFLTGGCTLIAAGLLLAVARRRIARAG